LLALAAAWCLLAIASLVIGTGVLALIAPRSLERPADGALVATWIGTLLLALVWLAVSLIQPLVPIVTVTLAVLLVAGALLLPSVRTTLLHLVTGLSPWSVVGMLALLLGVAFLCTQTVTFFDTGLYHAGLIEWLSRFGSVPGLALIEYRFGFTSSWFALAAVFNQGPLHGRIDALPGGYALWLASVHLSVSLHRLMRAQAALADWLVAIAYLMLLAWAARVGITVSPSPDVPVMVMCVTVAWAMLVIGTGHVRDVTRFGPEAVPVLLSALAFALKPTVVPLLVVSLVFYALRRGVGGRLIVLCGLVAVLVLPVLATSLVTTGCPLFPSPILCSSLPWSVGSAAAAVDQSTPMPTGGTGSRTGREASPWARSRSPTCWSRRWRLWPYRDGRRHSEPAGWPLSDCWGSGGCWRCRRRIASWWATRSCRWRTSVPSCASGEASARPSWCHLRPWPGRRSCLRPWSTLIPMASRCRRAPTR